MRTLLRLVGPVSVYCDWKGMDLCEVQRVCSKCILILLLVSCQVKGQSRPNYVVDTLVVMDAPAFNDWVNRQPTNLELSQRKEKATEKIKEYISLVIRQANMRLESLTDATNDFTMEMSIAEFSIGVNNPLGGTVNRLTKSIGLHSAIRTINTWVATQNFGQQYDYVLLLTGYNLQGDVNLPYDIKGIANLGTLCNTEGTSVAIVEDRGGFQSGQIVAHEMGHSLGSLHDGESPNTACPDSDRYLMSINPSDVKSSNRLNPWHFSQCSKRTIGDHLTNTILKNYPSCLSMGQRVAQEFTDSKDVLPGQVYDVRAQCQHMYGPQSNVCLGGSFKLSEVCTSMKCLDTSEGAGVAECQEHVAADGSSCGDGKICQKGQCVRSPLAPGTTFSDCYFGDAIVSIDGKTCSQEIASKPRSCYRSDIRSLCCKSCQDADSQNTVCPFGDKKTGCISDICQNINPDGTRFEEICCGTCGLTDVKDCVDAAPVDGVSCKERLANGGAQGCYDTSLAYQCCKTCAQLRNKFKVSGCEYGDRVLDCERFAYDKTTCAHHKDTCCHTCSTLSVGSAGTLQSSTFVMFIVTFITVSCLAYYAV